MCAMPLDPAMPALEVLLPTVGAPSFVAQMVQELTGTPVGPETAKLCRVQYRPTRDCVVLWSFPKPLDQPVLVSGLSSHRVGSEAARSVHDSAKKVCDTLGGRVYPYKHLPELQLFLQVFPLDIRLPGLAVAVSSTRARDAFSRCLGLSPSDVFVGEIEPVSYKPRRRCVLRYVVEV